MVLTVLRVVMVGLLFGCFFVFEKLGFNFLLLGSSRV